MDLYDLAFYVHVLAAIVGMGPAFFLVPLTKALTTPGPDTMTTLKWVGVIGKGPEIGGPLLILSGVVMGVADPRIWSHTWLQLSMGVLVALLAVVFGLFHPLSAKLAAAAQRMDQPNGQTEFVQVARKFHQADVAHAVLVGILILLMLTKPF